MSAVQRFPAARSSFVAVGRIIVHHEVPDIQEWVVIDVGAEWFCQCHGYATNAE